MEEAEEVNTSEQRASGTRTGCRETGRIFVLYFSILIFLIRTFKPGRLIESQQVEDEVEKQAQTLKTNL